MDLYFNETIANLYDLQYKWNTRDIPFYKEICRTSTGPILEMACGTGRILIPALEAGYPVEGLDKSPAMLDLLRKKLDERNLSTNLYQQSMLDFKIDKQFGTITIPFTSFFILTSQEDQIRCLENCREHLMEGGRVVLDFFVNTVEVSAKQDGKPHLSAEIVDDTTTILLYDIINNDFIKQHKLVTFIYDFYNQRGEKEKTLMHKLHLRWIYPDEFKLMIKAAGFSRFSIFGGFNGEPLTTDKQQLVAILEK